MLTIKIPVQNIEATRQIVLNHKIMDFDYKIKVENGFGHIPIKDETEDKILSKVIKECKEEITKQNTNYTIEIIDLNQNEDLETVKRFPRSITELLKDKLSEDERNWASYPPVYKTKNSLYEKKCGQRSDKSQRTRTYSRRR